MQTFIGTKLVRMKPMTRAEYNDFRGWTLPADENGEDEGYLVEYLDGGKPNTPHYAGYVSWSPKQQADAAYRPTTGMSFGLAIEALKKGERVSRAGWPLGAFVYHVPADSYPARTPIAKQAFGENALVPYMAYLAIKRADGNVCVFSPGMDSILADDWYIVE